MTSAIERLAMLHSHIKDNSDIKLKPEFPLLISSERKQYLNSNFQSVHNAKPIHFASSVIRSTNIPVVSSQRTDSRNAFCFDSILPHIELSKFTRSTPSLKKTLSNLEFDEISNEVMEMLRLFLGNNKGDTGGESCILWGHEKLGWDFLGSNIMQSLNDDVLCISTGLYSNEFAECLQKYVGPERNVTVLEADLGDVVPLELIRSELEKKNYGIIALTHTDNSTGILTNIQEISQLVKQISPNIIIAVDAVHSAGIEEIQVDNWGIDVILSAYQNVDSQSNYLSFILLSLKVVERISEISENTNYYNLQPSYSMLNFQFLKSLNNSLKNLFSGQNEILIDNSSQLTTNLLSRFSHYKLAAEKLRKILVNEETGITMVSQNWANCSNGMTALYLPDATYVSELLETLSSECDVSQANSKHPKVTSQYIRIGHTGMGLRDDNDIDLDKVAEIIMTSLKNANKI